MRKRDTVIWFFKEFFGLYDDPLVDRKDVDSEVSDPFEDDDDYWGDDDYRGDHTVDEYKIDWDEITRQELELQLLYDKQAWEAGGLSAPDCHDD